MVRDVLLVPWFEKFIKESLNGKRLKLNGERLKKSTVNNYEEILKTLKEYEVFTKEPTRFKVNIKNNRKQIMQEREYWKQFYRGYSDFLFKKKGCFDNYVGHQFKIIKCFFRYLKKEKYLVLHEFYEGFYVRREDIRIITLTPERFCFLVNDVAFDKSLNIHQRRVKDMLVFGCVCALRFQDLTHLRVREVELVNDTYFLYYRSKKTDTPVNVKLPAFAVEIYNKFRKWKKPNDLLFPFSCLTHFNRTLRKVLMLAGWTEIIGKCRHKNGEAIDLKYKGRQIYRFCDLGSSHLMRRTGITILLMMGMPEYLVRKISGHAAHSKSFFRYVNLAQSYITDEIDRVHEKLMALWDGIETNTNKLPV